MFHVFIRQYKQTFSPHKGFLVMIKEQHTSWMKDPTELLYSYKNIPSFIKIGKDSRKELTYPLSN